MKVNSDPNVVQILLILVLGGLFFLFLGLFMIFMVAPDYQQPSRLMLIGIGTGSCAFSISMAINYFRSAPQLTITFNELRIKHLFKSKTIKTKEITEVFINQKSTYTFLFIPVEMESTIIQLKNGEEIIFWDHLYDAFGRFKNGVKLSIDPDRIEKFEVLKKQIGEIIQPIDKRELEKEVFKSFFGNKLFNFYGLINTVFIGIFLFNITEENMFRGFFLSLLFLGLSGYHLHYFRISNKYFQVKNFIWFWKIKTYRIEDIQEIIKEHQINTPEAFRIRLKNFHTSDLQPAGSYEDEHWEEIIEYLEHMDIKVRS